MTTQETGTDLMEQESMALESSTAKEQRNIPSCTELAVIDQHESRRKALGGTPKQRATFLKEEVFIQTHDVIAITSAIEELFLYKEEVPEYAAGFRLSAPGGMGKDTIMAYFNKKYGPTRVDDALQRPVIHVSLRGAVAPRALLHSLLAQLDCFFSQSQTIEDLENNLLAAMAACGTKAIFINEAQHLVPVSRGRHEARLAGVGGDWFKGFIDKTSSLFILLGVPGWDHVFEADKQLCTRIPLRYEFSEFPMDPKFIGILAALDNAIPMPERAGLDKKPLAPAIHKASHGNWRRLSLLLHDAILSASKRHSPRIESQDLRWAYRLRFGRIDNPFGAAE